MNTYKGSGHRRPYSNTGSAIASGDVVVVNDEIGVALSAIAATTGTGVLAMSGVHSLTKNAGETWTSGEKLYWDTSPAELTLTASGNTFAGYAHAAANSAAVLADVLLNGRPGPDA